MPVKNFIKSTLVLSLLIVSSVSFAQPQMQQRSPEERAQRQTQWMQQNLTLTNDQNKKVYDIMLHHAQQADNARSMPAGQNKASEMQGANADKDAALKGILTGDQYNKYQQHEAEMKEKMKERRAGGMGNGGN